MVCYGISGVVKWIRSRVTENPFATRPERINWEEWSLIALTFSDGSTPV